MNTDTVKKLLFALHSVSLSGISISGQLIPLMQQHCRGEITVNEFVNQAIAAIKN